MKDLKHFQTDYAKYYFFFAEQHQEELFDVLTRMIQDTVKEIAPQIIREYLRENTIFDSNMKVYFEGKEISPSHLSDEITKSIMRQI